MTALGDALASYLELRRAIGYQLRDLERLLVDLVGFLEAVGDGRLTVEHVLAWSCLSPSSDRRARRLGAARGFAVYLSSLYPDTEIPPTRLFTRSPRPEPRVCSPAEITGLLRAARPRPGDLTSLSAYTVVGLLAVTGMRLGEALGLDDTDFDRTDGVLIVHGAKFGKSRELPLRASTVAALTSYMSTRDAALPRRAGPALFVAADGGRLSARRMHERWPKIAERACLVPNRRRPRMHDLRHSFAVNTLRAWHEQGLEVEPRLAWLSTYLGHVSPANTYWYLSATPDLLGAAARRLEAGGYR